MNCKINTRNVLQVRFQISRQRNVFLNPKVPQKQFMAILTRRPWDTDSNNSSKTNMYVSAISLLLVEDGIWKLRNEKWRKSPFFFFWKKNEKDFFLILILILTIMVVLIKMGRVCFSEATMTGQDGAGKRSIHPLKPPSLPPFYHFP